MKILAIDIGTYSIKFYETIIERRRIKIIHFHEVLLSQYSSDDNHLASSLDKTQSQILLDYFQENDFDGKIIFQLPNRHITTRYLDIPVTNKKKAEMMIGFLIEETIPFSLNKVHFTKTFYKNKVHTKATVQITTRDQFDEYLESLNRSNCIPNYLTSENSIIESWAKENKIQKPTAIMDIGHQTTKVYFIVNQRVVSNHISHIGGKLVDDVIAHTYQIPNDEAIIYKHDNCFFLTEDQYEKVNDSQKEFGQLMKKTFWPLILDFKRWELGCRLNYNVNIETLYLVGGTSQIRNIDNFFTESLNTKSKKLDFFHNDNVGEEHLSHNEKTIFSLANQMTSTLLHKNYPTNFLTGSYSVSGSDNIPLHSIVFVASRTVMFSALASVLLLINIFLLQVEEKSFDKRLNTLLKSPALNMTNRERRNFRKTPKSVLKSLNKKHIELGHEIATLKSAKQINAMTALKNLSKQLGRNKEVDVVYFENIKQDTKVLFESKDVNSLKNVVNRVRAFNLLNSKIKYKDGENSFELTYNGI